jgi:glycosyltransferase 2 family protein
MQKYKSLILKITISGLLFYFLFRQIDLATVMNNFRNMNYSYIPFVLAFLILNYVFSSLRWKALLIFEATEHVKIHYLTKLYFVGSFFNNFMPTSIGGDVYKFVKLGKKINNMTHGFSATFMERFTGVIILFLITLISFPLVLSDLVDLGSYLNFASASTRMFSVLLSVFVFVLFLLGLRFGLWFLKMASGRVSKLEKLYNSISAYKGERKVISMALLTSVVVQLLSIFTQYFIFLALGVQIPVLYALTVFPVIALASFLPISLNGIGVQDGLYANLFAVVGIAPAISLSASILYHLFRLVVSLVGGVLYAFGKDV